MAVPEKEARGGRREGEASRVKPRESSSKLADLLRLFLLGLTCACREAGRVSRFIASPLVSRSRAGLAHERAASVNLERIQRCWLSSRRSFEEKFSYADPSIILKFFRFPFSSFFFLSFRAIPNPRYFTEELGAKERVE